MKWVKRLYILQEYDDGYIRFMKNVAKTDACKIALDEYPGGFVISFSEIEEVVDESDLLLDALPARVGDINWTLVAHIWELEHDKI